MRQIRLIPLALVGCLALVACAPHAAPPPAQPTPQVSVATPLQEKIVDWDDFTGRFQALQHVDVRARAGGFIQAVHFRDGQPVKAGQLLFTLDPRPAEALLAAAEAQAGLARGDLQRSEKLVAAQAISREEYESRKAAVLVADSAVRARRLDVEFTRVTAPIGGLMSDRRVDPGNVIAGGTSAADVLTTITSTDPIHFVFDASEAQLLKYQRQAGQKAAKVQIRLQDEADFSHAGVIDFSDNVVDDASGATRMRAAVRNPNGFIKPGMFGSARVEGSSAYVAMLIPATSVISDGPRKVAYVVEANGTVAPRPLQLGPIIDGLQVVRSGLRPDDRVIVNGVQRAQPGQKVEAKPTQIVHAKPAEPTPTTAPPAPRTATAAAN